MADTANGLSVVMARSFLVWKIRTVQPQYSAVRFARSTRGWLKTVTVVHDKYGKQTAAERWSGELRSKCFCSTQLPYHVRRELRIRKMKRFFVAQRRIDVVQLIHELSDGQLSPLGTADVSNVENSC